MPDLYRLSVGPVGAAYYQQHFQRFETLGKTVPCWNHGAAFFTLAWLILRKLWRPAGIYAAVLAGVLALWWWGLHGRVPLAVEASVCLLLGLLLCVVPGFMGTGLYYHHVRKQTLHTLTHAKSLAQARVQLASQAIATERLHIVASVQALAALLIGAALFYAPSSQTFALPDTSTTQPGTGPQLVIPSVESIRAQQPELPAMEPLPALEPAPAPAPAPAPVPAEPLPAPAAEDKTSAAPEAAKEDTAGETLSIVNFAQSVPVQFSPTPDTAAATAATTAVTATAATVAAASAAPAPQKAKAEAPSKKPVTAPAAMVKTKAAPAAPGTSSKLIPGKYYLNAGVYAQASNVDAAVQQLNRMKLGAVRQTIKGKNGTLTRLYIGPFEQRKQAEQAAVQAQKLRMQTQVLKAR